MSEIIAPETGSPPLPEPAAGAWSGVLGEISSTLAAHTHASPTGIASHVLSYVSSCLGTVLDVGDEEHPGSVWTMCVGGAARSASSMVHTVLSAACPHLLRANTGVFGAPDIVSMAEEVYRSDQEGVRAFLGDDPVSMLTAGGVRGDRQLRFLRALWQRQSATREQYGVVETYRSPKAVVAATADYGSFSGRRVVHGRRSGAYSMFLWSLCDERGSPRIGRVPDEVKRQVAVSVSQSMQRAYAYRDAELRCDESFWEGLTFRLREPRHRELYPGEVVRHARSHVLRTAQVCAALDGSADEDVLVVREVHLAQALAWWEYSQDAYAWSMHLGPTPEQTLLMTIQRLTRWMNDLLDSGVSGVSRTDISAGFFRRNLSSRDLEVVLSLLPTYGFEEFTVKGRGRPKRCWRRQLDHAIE